MLNVNISGKKGAALLVGVAVVAFLLGILVQHLATKDDTAVQRPERLVEAPSPNVPAVAEAAAAAVAVSTDAQTQNEPADATSDPQPPETSVEIQYSGEPGPDKWEAEQHLVQQIIERIDANNIKENLRYLSAKPHMASTARDDELASYIRDRFQEAGFDVASLLPYNFLLSLPDAENPNKIYLQKEGQTIFESKHKEVAIHPDDDDPEFVHAFNAFTPAGTVSTAAGIGVVYVNYGRLEDFKQLEELGINITGHIAIVRYGKIFRGNKVKNAEDFGAVGTIIFSDPEDVAAEGTAPEDVYDSTFWLPGTGMQRGSTSLNEGDPLTPGWPSTEHAYRLPFEEAKLVGIPAQPIGYSDARQILERLGGDDAPEEWQGLMENMTYKLGPYFNYENRDVSVTLSTHNYLNITRNYNVIGIIKGEIEPDRYVMLGNHRDAWGYGASDPSSGTAQLLESARVFGSLLKEGWRPRRSIVFLSWGAEEHGLMGSTEWVEENIDKLQSRGVAYVNTDTCASGPILHAIGSPMMFDLTYKLTKLIPGVVDESKTLYDEWKENQQLLNPEAEETPMMDVPGSGSDHAHFLFYAGIPSMDIWFRRDKVRYNITTYPSYHTGYETFHMVSTFVDPEFRIIQGCGRLASLILKYISDSSILPYSIQRFSDKLLSGLKEFEQRNKLMEIYEKYNQLEEAATRLTTATKDFVANQKTVNSMNSLELRALNDQLMKLEQSFILPQGLPGREAVRHVAFAPSQFDNYASAGFPGLSDLLHDYEELGEEDRMLRDKEIKRHISDITIMIDRATSLLKETHLI